MSKIKLSFTAVLTLIMLSVFAAMASAEFTATSTNPAPGIYVGDVDNNGEVNTHKTHGNFQNNTNSCANCHSTHNGQDSLLLKFQSSEPDMCFSCHDGTMGFYNVLGQGAGAGTFNASHDSASMHNVGDGVQVGAAPGAYVNKDTADLQCSSCHNPHGSVNDRLLKETVIGSTLYSGLEKGTKAISLELTPDPAFAEINNSTTNSGLVITTSIGPKDSTDKVNYSKFCSTCHDDYLASRSAGRPSNADKAADNANHDYLYTHGTNSSSTGRNCASCHYAHGTDITLLKDTQGKTIADYVAIDGWEQETAEAYMKDVSAGSSALKKYTNMAICWTCHQTSAAIDTQQPEKKYTEPVFNTRYNIWQDTFIGKKGIR